MMFWRYLCFICLLGVPNSRIVTSASIEFASDPALDDALVDRIVSHLTGGDTGGGNEELQKKDKTPSVIVGGGTEVKDTSTDNVQNKEDDPEKLPEPARQHGSSSSGDGIDDSENSLFLVIAGGCAVFGFIGLVGAGVCYYKYRKSRKAAINVEYPAYGVTGPMKERIPSPGDRKLAQSAQMYHYQHQKQQMIAMEKANGDMKHDASDDDSEEDNVEGDYTVYECPGLAPTGEMEVKNPLFRGDETPVTPNKDTAPPEEPSSPKGAEH